MKGVLLRSRASWVAEGEQITKYFCGLEKRNYVSKQVNKLAASNGSELHEAEDIIQEVKTFYERLYQKKQLEECENLNDMAEDIPTLTQQDSSMLEGDISLEEASAALRSMTHNKNPGLDGFTAEFFKVFWLQLSAFVV